MFILCGVEFPRFFMRYFFLSKQFKLDIFETPVTVTPQQEISKTWSSSQIP